ncbi:multidrug/biocide efflux PACE transporter [Polaromonas sp.]|uniref:multidrug/biocide efflux PACE transporter n=1 Tax=Polaromonas sp. TaxID=1869339 RepID=UPI003BB77AF3
MPFSLPGDVRSTATRPAFADAPGGSAKIPPNPCLPRKTRLMHHHKSVTERFFHALGFEVLAIAICAPLGAWLLGYSLGHIGLLTLMISLIAMSWNMLFNLMFDHAQRRMGFDRTLVARAIHALVFEVGLLLAVVPLAAWWLDIGLWQAFVLDIGIALFFLPYTVAFNWTYDHLRERFIVRKIRRTQT